MRHSDIMSKRLNESSWVFLLGGHPSSVFGDPRVPPKMKVLQSITLSKTLDCRFFDVSSNHVLHLGLVPRSSVAEGERATSSTACRRSASQMSTRVDEITGSLETVA